jgi:5'-nucleotidase
MGFEPNKTVSCLPSNVELDGRSSSVRNFPTLLSKYCCECLIKSTVKDFTIIGIFNTGTIRIDDILRGNISEYDILRVLPYGNNIISLSVPGKILVKVLSSSLRLKGSGMLLSYCGIETPDEGKTWIINGTDISETNLRYNISTIDYAKENTDLNDRTINILQEYNITQTKSLLNYLKLVYPPC